MSTEPINPFNPDQPVEAAAPTATAAPAPTGPAVFPTGAIPGGPAIPMPGAPAAGPAPMPGDAQTAGPLPGMPGGIPTDGEQVIDLTGVKVGGQDQIEIGRHLAFCSAVNPFDMSKADKPMVTFTFTVMAGPMAGRSRKLYCSLSPDALFKLLETLKALGIEEQRPTKNLIGQLAPQRVVIMNVIAGKPYNGNPTTDFNRVEPATEFGFPPGTLRETVLADPRAQQAGIS